MDTALVRQFLDFFQEFINLCQLENWPTNDTNETEIRNAFRMAQHVEKCLDKFQKKGLLDEFLLALNSNQESAKSFLKSCCSDPPKYVLKKVINSKTKVKQMDVAFKVFLELYCEEKLENCLADIMVEAASKETLLKNLTIEFSKEKVIQFKSLFLLSELLSCDDPTESLKDLLQNTNSETVELLVVSMLNTDLNYHISVNSVVNAVTQVMTSRNYKDKQLWKLLLNVEEKCFIELCLRHSDLFKLISTALLDSGKLVKENMSAQYFYIDLTYSKLLFAVRKVCKNENLKLEFLDLVRDTNSDLDFWENMIS